MRQIVLDTETTGLSLEQGHRIIEIGCVELINRRYTGNFFHEYFNPEREVEAGALAVHGLSNEFLVGKPYFKDLSAKLLQFIQGAELIIHNAPFDVGFLNFEFQNLGGEFTLAEHCPVIDTLVLARQKHPGQQNSLDALCRRYQVDNSQREFHGALLDAKLLAEVYLAMTGGQGSLFSDESTINSVSVAQAKVINDTQSLAPFLILHADANEIAAHQQYLAAVKKVCGDKVIWPIFEEVAH